MLLVAVLFGVAMVCATAIFLRSRPSKPAAPVSDQVAVEALKVLRDVAGGFTAALTRITAPDRLPSPPGAPSGQPAAMPEMDWDPTDADPRYLDSEFAPLVPNVEFDHPAGGRASDVQGNGRR